MIRRLVLVGPALAMGAVVALSNWLVRFPIELRVGVLDLANILTWAAVSYPVAFLVTDLTNKAHGPARARVVVFVGFALGAVLSAWLAGPRIAIASGTAFFVAQMLDITIFDRWRNGLWWKAPAISSTAGAIVDTALFFTLAFSAFFDGLGNADPFARAVTPLFGIVPPDVPRWGSWAIGDLAIKLLVVLALLVPYRIGLGIIARGTSAPAHR